MKKQLTLLRRGNDMNVVKKIDNSDFEFYTVKLPLMLKRNRRQAFLSNELEKNHPCFSERCWWQSKLRYTKKGFVASIAVMDKVKLARYKEENPGKILKFEEKNKKIFFVEKEMITAFVLLFLFILFMTSFVCIGIKRNAPEVTSENNDLTITDYGYQKEDAVTEMFEHIIENTSLYNGNILSISLDENLLNINMCGCYPEDIRVKGISCSEITFKNSVPYFNIQKTFDSERSVREDYLLEKDETEYDELNVKIRKLILDNHSQIIMENRNDNSFEFETDNLSVVLHNISSFIDREKYFLNSICIDCENPIKHIKINFSDKNAGLNKILPVIVNNISVFQTFQSENRKSLLKTDENGWIRIGTVIDQEKKYEFYKDAEGKIRSIRK